MGTMRGMATSHPHAMRSAEISLGLRSARAVALVDRVHLGKPLGERGVAELCAVRDALARAAEAVERAPTPKRARGRRNIASVGLALSAATPPGVPGAERSDAAAAALRRYAEDLTSVVEGRPLEHPDELRGFLRALVTTADKSTARSGETLVTSER